MAVLGGRGRQARRDRRRDQNGGATALDLDAVATTVLDAAEAALGTRPTLTDGPTAVLAGAGPDAYSFELATDDAGWQGPLVARTSAPDVLGQETAWIGAVDRAGFPAPEVVSDQHDEGVVVFRPPPGTNLAGCMVDDVMAVPKFLAAFGQLHARLHALPVTTLTDGRADGTIPSPLDELANLIGDGAGDGNDDGHGDREALAAELGWLNDDQPEGRSTALCHGELNPLHVYVDGGDPSTAVPVNWTRARLADPAYDVAATLTAFWSLPIYVESAVQRTMVKMFRDSLSSAYLGAYTEASPDGVDDRSLRYWQAYHLAWLATALVRRIDGEPVGPWDPAANVVNPDNALADVRARFWDLAKS
jgi:aminoglycoside phosphotransferase (APT) family kinase protein